MDGDTSLSFLPFSFLCFRQGTLQGTQGTPILAGQAPFGVMGEPSVSVDQWHRALTIRHRATHPTAQGWHCALLPSQQHGKSTITSLAATTPNLPACQSHTQQHSTVMSPRVPQPPYSSCEGVTPQADTQASLGCFTSASPHTSQKQKFL